MDQYQSHVSYRDMQPPKRRNYFFIAYLILFGVIIGVFLTNTVAPRRESVEKTSTETSSINHSQQIIDRGTQSGTISPVVVTEETFTDYEHAIIAAVQKATPAVVTITTSGTLYYRYRHPIFEMFYGGVIEQPVGGLGSGVIVDPDGTIITNEHVISSVQGATRAEIKVELTDGRSFVAQVERALYNQDIAILKINAHDLPYLELNPSANLVQGQTVLAIGNPFGLNSGGQPTVTRGIVSATRRNLVQSEDNGVKYLRNMIQTDASINEGNSGGALIDLSGRLVGINTAIYTEGGSGSIGIGFAIPSDQVSFILESIEKYTPDATVRSGIGVQALTTGLRNALGYNGEGGVVIREVEPDSPGAEYGFRQGDIITDINGYPVSDIDQARDIFRGAFPGEVFELRIFRDGSYQTLDLVLGEKE